MLLLLHSAFMLSVVKMLLKREVRGCALNSHGNYIVDHGKIMELCFLNFCEKPAIDLYQNLVSTHYLENRLTEFDQTL